MKFISEIVKCNVPNKNNRVYTKECIEQALEDPVFKERLLHNCFFGGFMADYRINEVGVEEIPMHLVSHRLNKYWWEDDTLVGEFETLDTITGKALEKRLGGVTLTNCMATSGTGNLEINESGEQVVNNYKLISINFTEDKA